MIIPLPDTTTSKVQRTLVKIREEGGAVALGRVLTLVIATEPGHEEEAIGAANDASREHPMRVIVVSRTADRTGQDARLDAEIRVGGDAGASEVILLHALGAAADDEESLVTGLLLPDAPVVAWWPGVAPEVVSRSPIGRIAQRRITDASAQPDPQAALRRVADTYTPGDTDFAWTRLTNWRALLAAVLDQPPYEAVDRVHVHGAPDSPSTVLLAAWLGLMLQTEVGHELSERDTGGSGIHSVRLERASGAIELDRAVPGIATLTQPAQPTHHIALPRRSLRDCLAEELRRLAPDDLFGEVLSRGLADLPEAAPTDAAPAPTGGQTT